jgi:hypothetical protein
MQSQVKIPHLKVATKLNTVQGESAKNRTNKWRSNMNQAGFKYRGFWVTDEEYTRIKKMLKREKSAKSCSEGSFNGQTIALDAAQSSKELGH